MEVRDLNNMRYEANRHLMRSSSIPGVGLQIDCFCGELKMPMRKLDRKRGHFSGPDALRGSTAACYSFHRRNSRNRAAWSGSLRGGLPVSAVCPDVDLTVSCWSLAPVRIL
jgi:hypothetical protein